MLLAYSKQASWCVFKYCLGGSAVSVWVALHCLSGCSAVSVWVLCSVCLGALKCLYCSCTASLPASFIQSRKHVFFFSDTVFKTEETEMGKLS